MKKFITIFKAKTLKITAWVAFLLAGLAPQTASAQAITSPAPYCAPNHQFQGGGPCFNSWGVRLQRVRLANLDYWEPTCDNTVTSTYRFFRPPTADRARLTPGNSYVLNVTTGTGTQNNGHSVGAWIDFNNNGVFEASEYLSTGTNMGTATAPAIFGRNVVVPCGSTPGTFRMRVSMNWNQSFSATSACATHNYGETWDFEVEVVELPELPKPNFTFPANIFVGNPINIVNTTPGRDGNFAWDLDLDGYDATTVDYPIAFASSGTRFLKLRISGCGVADSIVQAINVQNPSKAPRPDFYSNRTVIEEFDEIVLSDLSGDGPSSWYWEVFDPLDNFGFSALNSTDDGVAVGLGGRKNRHQFEMQDMGFFNVELTATNGVGSSKRTKTSYIEVLPFTEFRLGFGLSSTQLGKGTIFDKYGPNENYRTGANGDPTVNRLRIQPCGAITITLKVERLKLAQASHNFKVWDGPNPAFGTPLHPPGGFTSDNTTTPFEIVATSGAMYMELDTESGGAVDSGLIAFFETDFGVTGPPAPSIGIGEGQTVAYTGAITSIRSTSQNIFGIPDFYWEVDFNPVPPMNIIDEGKGFTYSFNSAGTYEVCMEITGCAGDAYYCEDITVVDPTGPTELDFTSSNIRPDAFEPIIISSKSDKANRFKWTIDPPNKFNFQNSNESSPNIRGAFSEPGAYTITLTAWNSMDSSLTATVVTKQNYVVVVDYCSPSAQIVSGDIGLRNVRMTSANDNAILLNRPSSTGQVAYENFAESGDPAINVSVGGTYNLTLSRASNADAASHAVFIDFNGDGLFGANERVLRVMNTTSITTTGSFKVPDLDDVYSEFPVRMRVVTSYRSEEPTACGPLQVGEYEDYLLQIKPYPFAPTLTLNGSDTLRVEQGSNTYSDLGAVAFDFLEGNISDRIQVTTDLDLSQTGIYFKRYEVSNASKLSAEPVTRYIVVTVDLTAPALTLLGANPDTFDVLTGTYVEPGYTAFDAVDGDVTAFVDVESNVNENVLGSYQIRYSAIDLQGNTETKVRNVEVVDRVAPVINFIGNEQVELGTFWFDQTSVTDNYWAANQIEFTKTFGFSGPVRWDVKGNYSVTYTAIDGSGNKTVAVRNYVVDDFTAPVVVLNTSDTVYHDVRTNYTPVNPTISDNQYAANQLVVEYSTNLNVNTLGLYTETYRVTDGSGNVTNKTRWVRVLDRIAPVISAPSICSKVGFDFNTKDALTITDNYYAADALIDLIQVITSNVNPHIEGFYTASYEVTDPSGNKSNTVVQNIQISAACEMITSVDKIENAGNIKLFPNPSDALFNVDFANFNNKVTAIEVVDNLGNLVLSIDASKVINERLQIDMTQFASGVYFLKVNGSDFNSAIRMVLVK